VISAIWEVEIERTEVQSWARVCKTHLNHKSWVWWCAPAIPASVESVNRRITVQPGLGIKMRLYLKAKKSWGSDSSGRKALNLSTNIIKKEKEMQ
jgi:hypothetical protein